MKKLFIVRCPAVGVRLSGHPRVGSVEQTTSSRIGPDYTHVTLL